MLANLRNMLLVRNTGRYIGRHRAISVLARRAQPLEGRALS